MFGFGKKTDPVCGMKVQRDGAAATEDYKGTRYYFCSADCHAKFKSKPSQYTA
jgi:Cu+-exporting ATPase